MHPHGCWLQYRQILWWAHSSLPHSSPLAKLPSRPIISVAGRRTRRVSTTPSARSTRISAHSRLVRRPALAGRCATSPVVVAGRGASGRGGSGSMTRARPAAGALIAPGLPVLNLIALVPLHISSSHFALAYLIISALVFLWEKERQS